MNAFWVWLLKTAGSIALTAPIIWGGAYWIADYVSDKYASGLKSSIEGLQSSVSDLNITVTSINTSLSQQLIDLERQRANLAIEIAREVGKLQNQQGVQERDIQYLRDGLDEIKETIKEVSENTKVRLTADGGKTFTTLSASEALTKFGPVEVGTDYVIAPWTYKEIDPQTGRFENEQK